MTRALALNYENRLLFEQDQVKKLTLGETASVAPVGLAAAISTIQQAIAVDKVAPRETIALPKGPTAADYKRLAQKTALYPEFIPAIAGVAAAPASSQKEVPLSSKLEVPELRTYEDLRKFIEQLKNFQHTLAKLQVKSDLLTGESVEGFELEVQKDLAKLQKLNQELKAAIAEHIKATQDEKKWGVWQNVLQYFIAATSIVFGVALIATGVGVVAGALLVAAGGLTLVNRIMSDTGAWKLLVGYFTESTDMQKKIASRIEMGMFLLSLAMSLTGGAMAFQAGALTELVTLDKAVKVVTLTTALINGGFELGRAVVNKKAQDMKAKILTISGETTDIQYKMQRDSSSIEEAQKLLQETVELIKRSISQLEVMAD
ncbi:MAG: hypothetical protein JSS32_10520 [Verrucomicrobia bacterium]|nr:hypothetical protein [Verrucomicrobiota bacterium]